MKATRKRKHTHATTIIVAILLVVFAVYSMTRSPRRTPSPGVLTVLCDTSIQSVANELASIFQRRHDAPVEFVFVPALALMDRLAREPHAVDVVLFGSAIFAEQAEEAGLIESPLLLARSLPVLLVQRGNPAQIDSLDDLARPGLRIALPEMDTTSLGNLMPHLLERYGLDFEGFASNVALTAETDRELGDAVRFRRVDAAMLSEPVARQFPQCEIVPILLEAPVFLDISIALSAAAGNVGEAQEFMAFAKGRASRAVLEQQHYIVATELEQ